MSTETYEELLESQWGVMRMTPGEHMLWWDDPMPRAALDLQRMLNALDYPHIFETRLDSKGSDEGCLLRVRYVGTGEGFLVSYQKHENQDRWYLDGPGLQEFTRLQGLLATLCGAP